MSCTALVFEASALGSVGRDNYTCRGDSGLSNKLKILRNRSVRKLPPPLAEHQWMNHQMVFIDNSGLSAQRLDQFVTSHDEQIWPVLLLKFLHGLDNIACKQSRILSDQRLFSGGRSDILGRVIKHLTEGIPSLSVPRVVEVFIGASTK